MGTDSFVVPNTYSDLHHIPAMLETMAVQSTYQQNLSSFAHTVLASFSYIHRHTEFSFFCKFK